MSLSDAVAAQIMGELHSLTKKIEEQQSRTEEVAKAIANAVKEMNGGKTVLRENTEKFLINAVTEINHSVAKITGAQKNIEKAAENAAREILVGDDGPIKKFDRLVAEQNTALGFLNRAAETYGKHFVLRPMLVSTFVGSIIGGLIVKFI